MIEIFALIYFSQKAKRIAEQKGENPTKWVLQLIATWVGVEALVIILAMLFFDLNIETDYIKMAIPAMLLGLASAFFTIKQLENKEENTTNNSLDEFATKENEDKFKHFR